MTEERNKHCIILGRNVKPGRRLLTETAKDFSCSCSSEVFSNIGKKVEQATKNAITVTTEGSRSWSFNRRGSMLNVETSKNQVDMKGISVKTKQTGQSESESFSRGLNCQLYACRKQAQKCEAKADCYLDVTRQNVFNLQKNIKAAPNIGYFILKQSTINREESSHDLQGVLPFCQERQPTQKEGGHDSTGYPNEQCRPLSSEAFFKTFAK